MMNISQLTDKAQKEIEESFDLNERAWKVLNLIASEFKTDLRSTACFDLRIVKEAIAITKRMEELKKLNVLL